MKITTLRLLRLLRLLVVPVLPGLFARPAAAKYFRPPDTLQPSSTGQTLTPVDACLQALREDPRALAALESLMGQTLDTMDPHALVADLCGKSLPLDGPLTSDQIAFLHSMLFDKDGITKHDYDHPQEAAESSELTTYQDEDQSYRNQLFGVPPSKDETPQFVTPDAPAPDPAKGWTVIGEAPNNYRVATQEAATRMLKLANKAVDQATPAAVDTGEGLIHPVESSDGARGHTH